MLIESRPKFETNIVNLADLNENYFNIPAYQRPYVWGDEQIHKLINDCFKTFNSNPGLGYFAGTILTNNASNMTDLVDGQQRFTTLWLTAYVFKKNSIATELTEFLQKDKQLRIKFQIRKEVQKYLNQLLNIPDKNNSVELSASEIMKLPYLIGIARALTTIEGIIDQIELDKKANFGNYLYKSVFFIKNTTPKKTDINKLFSTVNSSGVQLEQSDIVKSNLLHRLPDQKTLYGKIWEACENMNNFFEQNAKEVFISSEWRSIDLSMLNHFDELIFKYKDEKDDSEQAVISNQESLLSEILSKCNGAYLDPLHEAENEARNSEEIYCRSVINFSQLLLHAYRIHLKFESLPDFLGTFHINRLVEIFSEMEGRNNANEIKRFFKLLWKIRWVFDKYVVKWITSIDDKTERLELVNINRNSDGYYSREKYSLSPSLMLQSVLYFTGDYIRQYWLTPFLWRILQNTEFEAKGEDTLLLLENIDNQLSCTGLVDKVASWQLMSDNLSADFDVAKYLNEAKGTSFRHYWFLKLEYVLWKQWEIIDDERFKKFRITSKNSIEHIFPQSKRAELTEPVCDYFGNLVLLSVGQNSEYNAKAVTVKKAEFKDKDVYDSLKSYYIFQYDTWNSDEIQQHQKEMISTLVNHYSQVYAQSN